MQLHFYLQQEPWIFHLITALFGLAVGSFLNVVIFRLPVMMENHWRQSCREILGLAEETPEEKFNLVVPRSRCPDCGHLISALQNIPVLSYLLLKGKCAHCGAKISLRYPLIESATALLSLIVAWRFGYGWHAGAVLLLTWALIALTMIDYDVQLLPDSITLPFLWAGLILSLGNLMTNPHSAILGAAGGYLSLWTLHWVFKLATGKEGMGHGDFKLFALFGAWLGWQYLLQIILLSSLVGAAVGLVLILARGHDRNIPIPFGPYLAAAGWISLLWGKEIHQVYFRIAGLS